MKEYIERETLIQNIEDNPQLPVSRLIKETPDADVAPVRHGEWICETNEHNYFEFHYSLCGRVEEKEEPYCHCGAKMDGGKE